MPLSEFWHLLGGTTRILLASFRRSNRFAPRLLFPGDPPEFPDPSKADAEGLLAIGGDLSPQRLLTAYRAGIFPWYNEDIPILWWSPDPRGIIELDGLHVSRRLARTVRSGKFRIRHDTAFAEVMLGCADRPEGTWITADMFHAYCELHRLGYAHSVECWKDEQLAGGVYGVAIGGLFAAESMFTRVTDASKVALVHLVEHLRQRGYCLLDVQQVTPHTASLGAVAIPRADYLRRLQEAVSLPVTF